MFNKTEQEIMKNWKGDIAQPIVSVCTITYNHEKYIAEALDSFLIQDTDFPFEIIIDDDCSLDGTGEVIKQYMEKYPNIIKANLRENNVGMMANFTENIKRAKGDYIAICEGDDYWINDKKLMKQIRTMQKYPDCEISFHPANELMKSRNTKILSRHNINTKVFFTNDIILGGSGFCPTASLVLTKSVVKSLPTWFEKAPIGDYYLQVLGSLRGGALYLNDVMSVYRSNNDSSWSKKILSEKEMFFKWSKETYRYLEKLNYETNSKYFFEINVMKRNHHRRRLKSLELPSTFKKEYYSLYKRDIALNDKILWHTIYKNEVIYFLVRKIKKIY